jgi:NgoPII restriction endonuclease
MSNLLKAIKTIIENPITEVSRHYASRNRANSVGDALENYIKDVFCGTINESNENLRLSKIESVFSWSGNQNQPPDLILKNGDAIETKKIQSPDAALALNSSHPKSKVYFGTTNRHHVETKPWQNKDIIYAIGCTNDSNLKYLWFVYGDCFVADKEIYEKIKQTISAGINSISGVEFTETKELGKVKKVDPLGVTDLRIRGMWHIENPNKIFRYINPLDESSIFQLSCLMRAEKFDSFPSEDKNFLLSCTAPNYSIQDVKIKNPNNPSQRMDAKLIIFKVLV